MANVLKFPSFSGRRRRAWQFGLALSLLGIVSGCGETEPTRYPVSGLIKLDGKLLPEGSITFSPIEGITAANAEVRDGNFSSQGATAGKYQVEINAIQTTGKQVRDLDSPELITEEVKNAIPTRYNVKSELTVEIKPEPKNDFKFELTSIETTKNKKLKRRRR